LLFSLLVPLACDRPTPRVVCHNSNCVEPTNPTADDTLEALDESLALVDADDVPFIDGIEIDIFWRGEDDTCIYAHDLSGDHEPVEASVPVARINDHLAARAAAGAPTTNDGGPFLVYVELKAHVGESKSEKHSPEQLVQHASCGIDVVTGLATGAAAAAVPMRVVITSFDPALLSAVADDPRWAAMPAGGVTFGLGAIQGPPPPLDTVTVPLAEFADVPLTDATVHPHWLRRGELNGLRDRGLAIGFWMFQAVPETFDAIERIRPDIVTTSEATLMQRWLKR
jgi:hypothetical protein